MFAFKKQNNQFKGWKHCHQITEDGGTLPIVNNTLKNQIIEIFREDLGINAICCISKRVDRRYFPQKRYKEYRIDVNGRDNLRKWNKGVGFISSKHLTKLQLWQDTGKCRPYSTIGERK